MAVKLTLKMYCKRSWTDNLESIKMLQVMYEIRLGCHLESKHHFVSSNEHKIQVLKTLHSFCKNQLIWLFDKAISKALCVRTQGPKDPPPPCTHQHAFGRPPLPPSCVRTIWTAPIDNCWLDLAISIPIMITENILLQCQYQLQ